MNVRSIGSISVTPCESAAAGTSLLKRAFDAVVSCLFVVAFAPAIALLAILVMLDGGPALYAQKRVGRNGLIFRCWKFRTMVEDADLVLTELLATDPALRLEYTKFWKLKDDPRVTKVGKVLRRSSLDELPQIFNVIRGDMSLVGPRPRSIDEIRFFESMTPEFNNVYKSVKPGLTGLWQISGRNRLTLKEKGELDAQYARSWSFRNDLAIILATVPIVILGDGAF
jgi:lipopolysaccharide/colanic/teichoic acid biosynthesis glycosyltransferase